jgi:hypothetical protein
MLFFSMICGISTGNLTVSFDWEIWLPIILFPLAGVEQRFMVEH